MAIYAEQGYSVNLGGRLSFISTALPVTSGINHEIIKLDKPGDSDDNKCWDTISGGLWKTASSLMSPPTATHLIGGYWYYSLPSTALVGKEGGFVSVINLTDHLTPSNRYSIEGLLDSAEIIPAGGKRTDRLDTTISSRTTPADITTRLDSQGLTTTVVGYLDTSISTLPTTINSALSASHGSGLWDTVSGISVANTIHLYEMEPND